MAEMRLVLDTDVILSGLRSSIGASRVLLQAIEAEVVTPLVSVAAVIEYEAVLKRPEHLAAMRLDVDEVERFLDALIARADHIETWFRRRPSIHEALLHGSALVWLGCWRAGLAPASGGLRRPGAAG